MTTALAMQGTHKSYGPRPKSGRLTNLKAIDFLSQWLFSRRNVQAFRKSIREALLGMLIKPVGCQP
jgi:hypothetical protein